MYECIICKIDCKSIKELEEHVRIKHEIHSTSERVINHIKCLKIRDEVLEEKSIPVHQPEEQKEQKEDSRINRRRQK